MPKIDIAAVQEKSGSRYPAPYDGPCNARRWRGLGEVAGLTQFGVNLMTLDPGVWSSQRHWHSHEDEFLCVLEGAPTMVTDAGEEVLGPGDCAAFPAGDKDGHHL
ncbi:MAG: cupin domain-containing protein, partial [Maricaulaceae bacterium]